MKQRLRFLDAARGLAIYTVVYSHICLFCLPDYNSSAVINFLRSYFLNAFFFISGFLAYRSPNVVSGSLTSGLIKKIWQLLIPTIVVGTIYALSHNIGLLVFYGNDAKYGYWFTLTLFEMYVIYFLILKAATIFKSRVLQTILLILTAIIFYGIHKTLLWNTALPNALGIGQLTYYMPFFCIGALCNCYSEIIKKAVKIKGGILITCFFAVVLAGYMLPVPSFVSTIAIVAIMTWTIKELYKRDYASTVIRKMLDGLESLGRNTLEIYFLHYFILFQLPTSVGSYLSALSENDNSLSLPEFIIVGTTVIIICIVCIVLARMLKTIPYISLLAFGKPSLK